MKQTQIRTQKLLTITFDQVIVTRKFVSSKPQECGDVGIFVKFDINLHLDLRENGYILVVNLHHDLTYCGVAVLWDFWSV